MNNKENTNKNGIDLGRTKMELQQIVENENDEYILDFLLRMYASIKKHTATI